jgi:hypothetical protein
LITRNPSGVLRILDDGFLLVAFFDFNLFCRYHLLALHEIQHVGTTECRHHQSFPHQRVVSGEKLGGRCSEGSGKVVAEDDEEAMG